MESERRSKLFTVRLWLEEIGDAQTEWRGKVRDKTSGETRHVRDWTALRAFLLAKLEALDGSGGLRAQELADPPPQT